MRVVHVLRKKTGAPATWANVLDYETGALNIASSRAAPHDGVARRWPANLVLVHDDYCRRTGVARVRAAVAVRHRSGGHTVFSEHRKPPLPDMTYGDASGMERVVVWACAANCPVGVTVKASGPVSRFFVQFGPRARRGEELGALYDRDGNR